jgi:cellobiose transport system substrate-binding protein
MPWAGDTVAVKISRRGVLGVGFGALASGLAGCGGNNAKVEGNDGTTAMWIWPGGLSDKVVASAVQHFAADTKLVVSVIDGIYLDRLQPALSSGTGLPAIAGIKGEDIASLLPRADRFVDLNSLGAQSLRGEYLTWKWQQGSTLDNRLIGLPIDIGPTALFYRRDLFRRAGLPDDPAGVAARIPDWDSYLTAGRQISRKLPGVRIAANCTGIFSICFLQGAKRFVSEGNQYIGDQPHIRHSWDIAVRVVREGVSAGVPNEDPRWKTYFADGKVAADPGPAWHASDLQDAAPSTAGKWGVAGGVAAGANQGGSFLAIPADGPDHDLAFQVITWLLSADNQAKMFSDAALFPSTPAAYTMPQLTAPDQFFSGQRTVEVFAASAKLGRRVYEAPADAAIYEKFAAELVKFENHGKDPAQAWQDAVTAGRQVAKAGGVTV